MTQFDDGILLGQEARESLVSGAKKLARAVGVTLGPAGQLVVIDDGRKAPHVTKDGVTVAYAVSLGDPIEAMGCHIVRDAANQTAIEAGDGTTTATLLASSMLEAGSIWLRQGLNATRYFDGFDTAESTVVSTVADRSKPVSDPIQLERVATISANHDERLGKMIAEIFEKLGPGAVVSVENSRGFETRVDYVEGTQIDRGFVSPHFATDATKNKCVLEKPVIAVFDKSIENVRSIAPVLEEAVKANKPLLIVAHDYSEDAIGGIVVNVTRGALRACCIKGPEFGLSRSMSLRDLACLVGASVIDESAFGQDGRVAPGFKLGSCDRIDVYREKSILLNPKRDTDALTERQRQIEDELSQPGKSQQELDVLRRRLDRTRDGVAILYVGGSTEVEMIERRDRVDDAIGAVRKAIETGIVPGGGTTFLVASRKIRALAEEEQDPAFRAGLLTIATAIEAPFLAICRNAGLVPELIKERFYVASVEDETLGFDASTCKFDADCGIIDPTGVVLSAYKNAASVAKSILSVGCTIVPKHQLDEEVSE